MYNIIILFVCLSCLFFTVAFHLSVCLHLDYTLILFVVCLYICTPACLFVYLPVCPPVSVCVSLLIDHSFIHSSILSFSVLHIIVSFDAHYSVCLSLSAVSSLTLFFYQSVCYSLTPFNHLYVYRIYSHINTLTDLLSERDL